MPGRDENKFMKRCLELALSAEGMTYPNPLVGSVVVHEGRIIGEGYHIRAGQPHAEVNAINSVKDRQKLKRSILYVNLEPCSHFGKTPPCADFIISNSIPEVVLGTVDTSPKVGGTGIKKLRDAGVKVSTGILENESRWLNRRFFTYNEQKRPWIILKWAQSSDGFIDAERAKDKNSRPLWISGKPERALVHRWRSQEQAILVGAGTVRSDKPSLNVRDWTGNDPLALVLSSTGEVNMDSIKVSKVLFTHNGQAPIDERETVLLDRQTPSCNQVTAWLYEKGIQSIFIEGGAEVLNHFMLNGCWDEARVFTGRKPFCKGVKSPDARGSVISTTEFEGSTLTVYFNEQSEFQLK